MMRLSYMQILVCLVMSFFVNEPQLVAQNTEKEYVQGAYDYMDYGQVISESIKKDWPENSLVRKGMAIRLDHDAAVIFDTDLMQMAAGTVGGWVDITETDYMSYKGSDIAGLEGRQVFGSSEIAGWAKEGSFFGPRQDGLGNLPRDWAHYNGYYRYGDQVILSYTVGESDMLELSEAIKVDTTVVFARNIQVPAAEHLLQALLLEKRESWSVIQADEDEIVLDTGENVLIVRLAQHSEKVTLAYNNGRIELHIAQREEKETTRVLIYEAGDTEDRFGVLPAELAGSSNPEVLTGGGPACWEEELAVSGILGNEEDAYVVDEIPVPFDNPWNAWMRLSGIDFFEDGSRAAVSTWNGDVWIVSGIDKGLENVRWKRFASGLFYPMGVVIAGDQIYVTERGQLTRLHDINGNGEADYYENFNNDGIVYPMAHTLGLQVDSEGYFYFFKNGNRVPAEVPQHGALMRVSPDGKNRELYSNGSRGSNTLGIGPDDTILSADQQGNWMPVDRIDMMKRGEFYGYRPHGGQDRDIGEFAPPLAWIPYDINNSSGSLTYSDQTRWGPLSGQWLLGSYGQANLQVVLTQELAEGKLQGAVSEFPVKLGSGVVRGRVNPADGQLYLVGLRGWTTLGRADGSFERIRYTGKKAYLPTGFRITHEGIELEFTEPLDRTAARNKGNYSVQRWEYIYSEKYGSPEVSFENPEVEGRDPVAVRSVVLSDDGKTLFLEIPGMYSVMQMKVEYDLVFKDGYVGSNALYPTVNWLSEAEADEIPEWQKRIITGYQVKSDEAEEEIAEVAEEMDERYTSEKFQLGKEAFQENCAACHVRGGAAPSLESSEWAAAAPAAVVRILLNGKRGSRGVMTPFSWMEDEELASVLSYIRQQWHQKEAITASEVEQIRKHVMERIEPWTEEELRGLNK